MSESEHYHDCLRLSETERVTLIRRLESQSGAVGHSQRSETRHDYAGHNVHLDLLLEAGRVARFLTCSRNLSEHGMSIVHGGFVYPGTRCRVTLTTRGGDVETIEGEVRRCHYVKGSLHELGIRFDRGIDPKDFAMSAEDSLSEEAKEALGSLGGRILFLDDSESELLLFRHHMRVTGVEVLTARTPREACREIGGVGVDLFVCDLDLGARQRDGEDVIQTARGAGFSKPILALTGTDSRERVVRAKQNGANLVLLKPYSPGSLLRTVSGLLANEAA